jgi:hypothetical protein
MTGSRRDAEFMTEKQSYKATKLVCIEKTPLRASIRFRWLRVRSLNELECTAQAQPGTKYAMLYKF